MYPLICHLIFSSVGWRYWGIGSHSSSGWRQRRHHRTSYLCPASPDITTPGRWDGTECCQTALRPACGRQITASAITLATHQGTLTDWLARSSRPHKQLLILFLSLRAGDSRGCKQHVFHSSFTFLWTGYLQNTLAEILQIWHRDSLDTEIWGWTD